MARSVSPWMLILCTGIFCSCLGVAGFLAALIVGSPANVYVGSILLILWGLAIGIGAATRVSIDMHLATDRIRTVWVPALIGAAIGLLLVTAASVAYASEHTVTVTVPVDTVLTQRDVRVGDVRELASSPVAAELIDATCDVTARASNGASVHPGNDLIVTSNGSTVLLANVERAPGAVTDAAGVLTLGSRLAVSVRVGPDRQFSGSVTVTATCTLTPPTTEQETTTTWQAPTTTGPTSSTETTAPTSTTEPPVTTSSTTPTTVPTTTSTTVADSTTTSTSTTGVTSTTGPSTTSSSPTTTTGETTRRELPRTGSATNVLTLVGLGLVGGGAIMMIAGRDGSEQ